MKIALLVSIVIFTVSLLEAALSKPRMSDAVFLAIVIVMLLSMLTILALFIIAGTGILS
jgi:antibiotic biosynthesis monooxygenase (ABM) superfamily enzyme